MDENNLKNNENSSLSDDDQNLLEDSTFNENPKRLKTDDYTRFYPSSDVIFDVNEATSSTASTSFNRAPTSKSRNYRKSHGSNESLSENSEASVSQETTSEIVETASQNENITNEEEQWINNSNLMSSTDEHDSDDEDGDGDNEYVSTDSDSDVSVDTSFLRKEKPQYNWYMVPEIQNRQYGANCKYNSSSLFQRRCYGSLHCVERLELMYKMELHEGCVNSMSFNETGTLLASGSDDLNCIVWDWSISKPLLKFNTKHKSNVFQSRFMPFTGDLHIVTSARDGQIRLHQVSAMEGVRLSRKLGQHRGASHQVAFLNEQPHVVLSSGDDGVVLSLDVRANKTNRLFTVYGNMKEKISLYSISSNPIKTNQFCISGQQKEVHVYDIRQVKSAVTSYFPTEQKKGVYLHVTSATYNHDGTEILASYSDDDIHLFDSSTTTNTIKHIYKGHRNAATVKGVHFFGQKSEFIVSGSDCGHIYFWDKNTEAIVQCLLADDNGVVNRLEAHPHFPIICSSGLDWDVKVWVPSKEEKPSLNFLNNIVRYNRHNRFVDAGHANSTLNDSQMMWMLWRHLNTPESLRTFRHVIVDSNQDEELTVSEADESSNSNSNLNEESSEQEDIDDHPFSCSPS